MARLYKRKKTYYADFYDQERGRRRISLKTKNEEVARALLMRWERLAALGEIDPWTDDLHEVTRPTPPEKEPTMGEAVEEFLQSRRDMNVTSSTLRHYSGALRRMLSGLDDSRPLSALTRARVRSYIHADGIAVATKEKRYRALRTFLRFHDLSILDEVQKPKLEEKLPVACRPKELEAIIGAMKDRYHDLRRRGRIPAGRLIWRAPVYQFAFLTGLRRSELARLRWRDVSEGHLTLRKQKSRREERLPLSEKAQRLLRRIGRGPETEHVFRSPYNYQRRRTESWAGQMTRTFSKYRELADVREEVTLHSLRAGFITQLAKAGLNAVAIKRLARHRSIETSLRYIEATGESFRSGLERAF